MQITLPKVKPNHNDGARERATPRGERAPAPDGAQQGKKGQAAGSIPAFPTAKGEFLDMVTIPPIPALRCASRAAVGDKR